MTSKNIVKIVSNYFNKDIKENSRDRDVIYMRSIANKLSREFTTETLIRIGKSTNSNHATVIHSLRKFDEDYKFQSTPLDVEKSYMYLRSLIKSTINNNIKQNYGKDVSSSDYNELLLKYSRLYHDYKTSNKEFRNKIKELEKRPKIDGLIREVLIDLNKLSDTQLSEFVETRLKPFKMMLENRKYNKVIPKIQGALLNR